MYRLRQGRQIRSSFAWPVAVVSLAWGLSTASADADPPCDGVCIYASPSGSGTDCSFAAPCSLTTGIAAIDLALPISANVHLILRGGTYLITQPLELGPQHSGSGAFRVFIENYTGEVPVLSGGIGVTGWTLFDAAQNIYVANVPAGTASRQLYVNGVRAQRARGFFNANYQKTSTGYTLVGFPTSWPNSNVTDLEFVALEHWKSIRCPVSSVTPAGSTTAINVAQPCWDHAQAGAPYFILGKPIGWRTRSS